MVSGWRLERKSRASTGGSFTETVSMHASPNFAGCRNKMLWLDAEGGAHHCRPSRECLQSCPWLS
jgi:hypothetical protein